MSLASLCNPIGARSAHSIIGEHKRHLIIPVMPTPNGRLHLGHIAGPFLKCDVLARHLRRSERKVWIISGSDIYESFVMLKSRQVGEPPADVALLNHHLIERDLHSLDIVYDEWIYPLHPRWKDLHDNMQRDVLTYFKCTDKAYERQERVHYDTINNRFVVGCWLIGRCPVCGADAGSYFCEACGGHFRPEEILDPRSRDNAPTAEIAVNSLFLKLSDPAAIRAAITRMNLPEDFVRAADAYLRQQADVRLTNPVVGASAGRLGTVICRMLLSLTLLCSAFLYCVAARINNWQVTQYIRSTPVQTSSLLLLSAWTMQSPI